MKLSSVAKFFNRTEFLDAYSGQGLGSGQLNPYEDNVRDGPTSQRRIFEVEPSILPPERRAIDIHGQKWLVGQAVKDSFNGNVIRTKWVLQLADNLADIQSPAEFLAGDTRNQAYTSVLWVRSSAETEITSNTFSQVQIFFAVNEDVEKDDLIVVKGDIYTALNHFEGAAGHLIVEAEKLDSNKIETVETEGSEWDPINEVYTGGETIQILRLRWQSDFAYYSQMSEDFKRGDMQAIASTRVGNGTVLPLEDGNWNVVTSQPRNGVYYLHLRRSA